MWQKDLILLLLFEFLFVEGQFLWTQVVGLIRDLLDSKSVVG